jgi:hypothetical protein
MPLKPKTKPMSNPEKGKAIMPPPPVPSTPTAILEPEIKALSECFKVSHPVLNNAIQETSATAASCYQNRSDL